MPRLLALVVGLGIVVYTLVRCIQTPEEELRYLPKMAWIIVVTLLPPVGALAWLILHHGRSAPRARPIRPRGPDDDPDFLRSL